MRFWPRRVAGIGQEFYSDKIGTPIVDKRFAILIICEGIRSTERPRRTLNQSPLPKERTPARDGKKTQVFESIAKFPSLKSGLGNRGEKSGAPKVVPFWKLEAACRFCALLTEPPEEHTQLRACTHATPDRSDWRFGVSAQGKAAAVPVQPYDVHCRYTPVDTWR